MFSLFNANLETLRYLGYVTHNAQNEITETARSVCNRLDSENVRLEAFGNSCGTFAAQYWNVAKREQTE